MTIINQNISQLWRLLKLFSLVVSNIHRVFICKNVCHYAIRVLWSQTLVQASSFDLGSQNLNQAVRLSGADAFILWASPQLQPGLLLSSYMLIFFVFILLLEGGGDAARVKGRFGELGDEWSCAPWSEIPKESIKKLYFLNVIWFSFLYHGFGVISNHYFLTLFMLLFLYKHFIPCFKMFCFIFGSLFHLELSFKLCIIGQSMFCWKRMSNCTNIIFQKDIFLNK